MDKQHIVDEIKRTAAANGGAPLGHRRFFQETGIKATDWERYWARWGDALREAGLRPNQMTDAYDDDVLIEKFIGLIRDLGRFPVWRELKLKARNDPAFPSDKTFSRLGGKAQIAAKLIDYCRNRDGYEDVAMLSTPIASAGGVEPDQRPTTLHATAATSASTSEGYVYMALLQLGREKRYKIGKAVLVGRRTDQLSIQLPEDLKLIHVIRTDDAYGIEEYWHKRFDTKNTRGEWFSLSRQDIDAFKRRKFM